MTGWGTGSRKTGCSNGGNEITYGNDYFGCLTVFPSEIARLNCINVTLVMDRDTFSAVSGSSLKVSAACTEGGSGDGDSYAGCEVEILVPEMDGGMRAEY